MPAPAMLRRLRGAFILLILIAMQTAHAAGIRESDLLPVEQAYVLSADASAADTVRIRWKIADGYYLYRHRISVQPVASSVRSGTLQLPRGEAHEDEYFGKTETYRGELVATLPGIAGAGAKVALKIRYQGCADAGLCYPPQTRVLEIALPAAAAKAPAGDDAPPGILGRSGATGGLLGGGALLGDGAKAAPLPEDRAFGFDAIVDDGNTVLLRFTPAPGYYLYRDRTTLKLLDADGIQPGAPRWPAGSTYHDEHFGDVVVFFRQIDVPLPLYRTKAEAQTATLRVTFQGCQTDGICYPPMTRSVRLSLPRGEVRAAPATAATAISPQKATDDTATAAADASDTPADAAAINTHADTGPDSLDPAPTQAAAATTAPAAAAPSDAATANGNVAGGLLTALLLALLGGLILNLMPCVLPVLSIKVLGLIENNTGDGRMRRHALWYTAGVLASFIAMGATILFLRGTGEQLGLGFQLQHPGIVAALGLVMFAFGLSLSGVWHVGGRWIGAGQALTERNGAVGDFFTGVLAVVVAAPCTAPFMAMALGWALSVGSSIEVLAVFASLGVGLALPVLMVGFLPALARWLPRPGAWMDTFKQVLAFPLYASAVWLLWVLAKQRGADAVGWWAAAALLVAFAAWAWTHARMRGTRAGRIAAVLALLALPWLIHTIAGLPVPPKPGASARSSTNAAASRTIPFSEQRLAELRRNGQAVLVNMTADWCITCKVNEKAVFNRQEFHDLLAATDTAYLVGDWTDTDPAITAFLQSHKAYGVPLYVVYPRGGGEAQVLPTVLTPGIVRDALEKASRP